MPYKNRGEYRNVAVHKSVIKKLKKYRIEDNESLSKIIKRIIEEHEKFMEEEPL